MEHLNTDHMSGFEYSQWLYGQQQEYGNCQPPKQPEPAKALANAFRAARKKQNVTFKTI